MAALSRHLTSDNNISVWGLLFVLHLTSDCPKVLGDKYIYCKSRDCLQQLLEAGGRQLL